LVLFTQDFFPLHGKVFCAIQTPLHLWFLSKFVPPLTLPVPFPPFLSKCPIFFYPPTLWSPPHPCGWSLWGFFFPLSFPVSPPKLSRVFCVSSRKVSTFEDTALQPFCYARDLPPHLFPTIPPSLSKSCLIKSTGVLLFSYTFPDWSFVPLSDP